MGVALRGPEFLLGSRRRSRCRDAGAGIQSEIEDPQFVVVLWVTDVLKLLAAAIALGFILPLARKAPRRFFLIIGWAVAGLLLVYGIVGWVQAVLWETGAHDVPAAVGEKAAQWKLVFWDPFWFLGGPLFLIGHVAIPASRPPSLTQLN